MRTPSRITSRGPLCLPADLHHSRPFCACELPCPPVALSKTWHHPPRVAYVPHQQTVQSPGGGGEVKKPAPEMRQARGGVRPVPRWTPHPSQDQIGSPGVGTPLLPGPAASCMSSPLLLPHSTPAFFPLCLTTESGNTMCLA